MMPADDVSDLRDVVDAINRLCETMKTSDYGDVDDSDDVVMCENVETEVIVESEVGLVSPEEIVVSEVETYVAELWSDASSHHLDVDPVADYPTLVDNLSTVDSLVSDVISNKSDVCLTTYTSNRIESLETVSTIFCTKYEANRDSVASDSLVTQVQNVRTLAPTQPVSRVESVVSVASESVVFDQEQVTASFEPASEMYYTASSEVSLLSEADLPDRIQEDAGEGRETLTRDDRNGVMAGHVAAMRERFESMTRANTPCPDTLRSVSPSLDVYRNITPSPDHLG